MALMEWSDRFTVGLGVLDKQHKQLVAMANELDESIAQGKGRELLSVLLERMVQYMRMHFATEEMMMSQWNYSGLSAHKAEHAQLMQQMMDFKNGFESGQAAMSVPLLSSLREWLVNHIMKTDMQYSLCAVR